MTVRPAPDTRFDPESDPESDSKLISELELELEFESVGVGSGVGVGFGVRSRAGIGVILSLGLRRYRRVCSSADIRSNNYRSGDVAPLSLGGRPRDGSSSIKTNAGAFVSLDVRGRRGHSSGCIQVTIELRAVAPRAFEAVAATASVMSIS